VIFNTIQQRRRLKRSVLAAIALSAICACSEITAPRLPDGAIPMQPMAVYTLWWSFVEECSARSGDFNRVRWYVVPGAESIPTEIGSVQGMWLSGNRIVVAGKSVRHGPLVRHEMLHALLQTSGHPRADFIGRCDGVVVCEWPCRDNDPAPPGDPDAVAVASSALEISVTVSPESPGIDILDGHIGVIVSARNPADYPVEVQLEPPRDDGLPITWRYSIWRGSAWWNHDERAKVPESKRFGAGETKRMIYDLWVGGAPWQEPFDAGVYDVYGAFNVNRTPTPKVITIRSVAVCCENRREVR
jgi:hypothetical protein